MSESIAYSLDDFRDLPFDVSVHAEALKSAAVLNLLPQSVRPMLRARYLVFVRLPSCRFRIGVAEEGQTQDQNNDSLAFEIIDTAESPEEAQWIRTEVERYFLRHYPGRTLRGGNDTTEQSQKGKSVFIACYPPED